MHNLKTNFDKILDITKSFFHNSLNADGNYYFYPKKPKMPDKENFETAPDKGYSAVRKSWYYDYKLHLATSVRGVFSSMDLTKASVHDVYYLNEVKHSGKNNCTGLSIRLLCKITFVTILQYINFLNNKPLNHLKYALAR